ncbi:MAG: CRISPR-associated endonuclease Cas2 [Ardenticatenia bacterium]|nr:MAG: CRISPR-associated endonuclease Cas2 [Ardenticatenia bacterium]
MRCLLVYDIPDDRTRTRVSEACLDYGLERIQYSAFLGELTPIYRRELMKRLRHILGKQAGKIQCFPLCERDWNARDEIIREEPSK